MERAPLKMRWVLEAIQRVRQATEWIQRTETVQKELHLAPTTEDSLERLQPLPQVQVPRKQAPFAQFSAHLPRGEAHRPQRHQMASRLHNYRCRKATLRRSYWMPLRNQMANCFLAQFLGGPLPLPCQVRCPQDRSKMQPLHPSLVLPLAGVTRHHLVRSNQP